MTEHLGSLDLRAETDVLTARRLARGLAESLGFDTTDQVRIATAVSELGRVVAAAGATAAVDFSVDHREHHPILVISARPDRPVNPPTPAAGVTGLVAIRRLMDRVVLDDDNTITITKTRLVAHRPQSARTLAHIRAELAQPSALSPMEELRTQHDELVRALHELQSKQDELVRLNDELQETNRGVVALYAELDERGEQLRTANDAKSQFLANVSHELRSPLNSINGLAALLRDPQSDALTAEQDNQVRLIAASTSELLDAVNGLLDIARAEAGKIQPDLTTVDVAGLVADLRTTLRTLTPPGVDLVVHVRDDLGPVVTDGVLLAQLVRNLISNALKFTEAGQVVVTVATQRIDGDYIDVEVADTGIGIAPEHHDLVFEEFYRVPGHLQVRARSTGLGLPYARRVATALGGSLTLTSAPGRGSTFRARVRNHQPNPAGINHRLSSVLVGDDDAACREMLRGLLTTVADVVVEATDADAVLAALTDATPELVLLDLRMPGGGGARVLAEIDQHPEWRKVAVVVISSSDVELGELRTQRPGLVTLDKAVLDRESLARAIAMTSAGAAG